MGEEPGLRRELDLVAALVVDEPLWRTVSAYARTASHCGTASPASVA